MSEMSPGTCFRQAVSEHRPLQVAGAINAYTAMLAQRAGFHALYLSGAGVANASYGLPDLGLTNLTDVVEDVSRITSATTLPLLVDADTGFGTAPAIARTVRQLAKHGAAGLHIEDQVAAKRCGHRPGKAIVSPQEMIDRIKAAVDGRVDDTFVIMARTDAIAVEGMDAAVQRAQRYIEAGADMLFPEAITDLAHYRQFVDAVKVPVLANITEFGKTPLFTTDQLADSGVSIALYPLSAFRAMSAAAVEVYRSILDNGTQAGVLDRMQTRDELYDVLGYHAYEQKLDKLFGNDR